MGRGGWDLQSRVQVIFQILQVGPDSAQQDLDLGLLPAEDAGEEGQAVGLEGLHHQHAHVDGQFLEFFVLGPR